VDRSWIVLGLLGAVACGRAGTGPTAVEPVTVAGTSVPASASLPAPRLIPTWVDPQLVGTLLVLGPDGDVRRWQGGAMRHCFAPEVDRATVEPVLADLHALTGVPRTETGPCNVHWNADYGRREHSNTVLGGTSVTAITSVTVWLYHPDVATARHEVGHVFGFGHSPRPRDLMNASPRVDDFSGDERALLGWLFGR
jgi:hypothetical protein